MPHEECLRLQTGLNKAQCGEALVLRHDIELQGMGAKLSISLLASSVKRVDCACIVTACRGAELVLELRKKIAAV